MKEIKLSMKNEQAKCFSIDTCEPWVEAKGDSVLGIGFGRKKEEN